MAYLGNSPVLSQQEYRNIDNISGSFNGSTTSFALLVNGVAPVPAPQSSNQCLISVNGVVQKPDDTGATGFRLSGGNIVFSAAPTSGQSFFGVILAGADYIYAGQNFPDGTVSAPPITFNQDLDTGFYRSGSGEVKFTANGANTVTFSSNGLTAPSFIPTSSSAPTNGVYLSAANTVAISTNGTGRLFVDSTGRVGVNESSPLQALHVAGNVYTANDFMTRNGGGIFLSGSGSYTTGIYNSSGALLAQTAGVERLRVTSAGLVGIGVSSPAYTLDVVGSTSAARIGKLNILDDSPFVTGTNLAASSNFGIGTQTASSTTIFTNNNARLTITSAGLVGIGTTSPGDKLAVSDGTNITELSGYSVYFKTDGNAFLQAGPSGGSSGRLVFQTNAVERARIDSSGRLLVGTSSTSSSAIAVVQGNATISSPGRLFLTRRNTASNADDELGVLQFADSGHTSAAEIAALRDGATWTSGSDQPTRLVFSTTADGSSSPTERMRISNNGVVTIKNGAVAEIGTLTDAATITPDFASNCNFTVTLGGARTIANPTNVTAGQSGSIFIVQDGTGGRTASWGSNWDWAGGSAPTLSTGANAVDRVDYICRSATSIHAVWTGNYS